MAQNSSTTLKRRGLMLVLASPPGGGKTTITRALAARDPQAAISVSATTRGIRPGEAEGEHYYFVSADKFRDMVDKGEMLEYALVYNDKMYGTPKAPVEKALSSGKDVLFDIDWQGARHLATLQPTDVVTVFILPPSWGELEKRLHGRARDTEDEIGRRLAKSAEEISHYKEFQYVVINNDLEDSIHQVQAILDAERIKRARYIGLEDFAATLKPGA